MKRANLVGKYHVVNGGRLQAVNTEAERGVEAVGQSQSDSLKSRPSGLPSSVVLLPSKNAYRLRMVRQWELELELLTISNSPG